MTAQIKTARTVATVFAALLMSSLAVATAVGPAVPVTAQVA